MNYPDYEPGNYDQFSSNDRSKDNVSLSALTSSIYPQGDSRSTSRTEPFSEGQTVRDCIQNIHWQPVSEALVSKNSEVVARA